ncbi:MAG: hotdog fold thioesterase [Bacteroidetes bacterium]|nr:hotdog fold thioesterase [Bacteroidota bacterium]
MIDLNSSIEQLNNFNTDTLMAQLGIEYLEAKEGYVKARMPVDGRTRQPMGILHGGASLALAETIGGMGSALLVDLNKFKVKGMSLNANHVGSVSKGFVYGVAEIIHKGQNTHVWNITISSEDGRKISISRLTNMIIKK